MPYASVLKGTRMGKHNKVYQGAIVGADPQDFRWKGEKTYCHVGDNNVIREYVIINRGIHPTGGTFIGDDCFIAAETHIGHDSVIEGKAVAWQRSNDCRRLQSRKMHNPFFRSNAS